MRGDDAEGVALIRPNLSSSCAKSA